MNLLFSAISLALCGSLAASAQLRPRDRFPITTDLVAAKLVSTFAQKGIILDVKQIALPAEVTATEEAPTLEVRSVEKLGSLHASTVETSSAVKLACTKAGVCLPFYAVVTQASPSGSTPQSKNELRVLNDVSYRATPVMKSGAHITLLVDSGTTHIQMPVVTMQSGSLHQQIKVRSTDHKQIFNAQVLNATTVRGTL